jgi:hypothetical protein
MSKQSTSRLTASKKNRPRPPRRRAAACPDVDWRDAMNVHCWHLGTLAGLLEVCGQPLEPEMLEGIGHVIGQDVEAMKALLSQLEAAR